MRLPSSEQGTRQETQSLKNRRLDTSNRVANPTSADPEGMHTPDPRKLIVILNSHSESYTIQIFVSDSAQQPAATPSSALMGGASLSCCIAHAPSILI
jgi:hypothetical protein